MRGASLMTEPSAGKKEPPASIKISDYNFRRPGQLSSTQLRALNTVHEFFAKKVRGGNIGGVSVNLTRLGVDTISYSNFIGSLNNPCFTIHLSCTPSETVLFDLEIPVARALTTSMLGDRGGEDQKETPLTSIEQSLASGWLEKTLPMLSEAWSMSSVAEFGFRTIEADPRFIQVMPDETPVVVMAFNMTVGPVRGQFSICYPLAPLQPMLEGLCLRMKGKDEEVTDAATNSERLLSSLKKVPFDLRAELGCSTLLASQLIRMRVGDVICLDRDIHESLDLYLGDRPVFKARLGRKGDQLAVQVAGRFSMKD